MIISREYVTFRTYTILVKANNVTLKKPRRKNLAADNEYQALGRGDLDAEGVISEVVGVQRYARA